MRKENAMTWLRPILTALALVALVVAPAIADVREVRLGVKGAT
jgi:hypothetical protein